MVRASDNPSRRRLEMIEYPDGEDLIDHRGRSKPIYKPSTPRPSEWKPGPMARLLLGIFPGLRLMVLKSVPAGLPYALLGLLAGLGALLLVLNWSASTAIIHELRIQPKWILLRGAAVLVLVAVYELLRLGAAVEEQNGGPWTPRIFAAAVLPSFVVVLGTPAVIDTAPKMLESTWFAALVLGFGALPASVACALDNVSGPGVTRFRLRAGIALVLLIGLAVGLPFFGVPLFDGLVGAARAAGFRVLPALLP